MFYMNMGVLNEGEQAEAYKKRKAEEEARKEKESDDRVIRRYKAEKDDKGGYDHWHSAGYKMTPHNPNYGLMHPIKTCKGVMNDRKRERDITNKTMQVVERNKIGTPISYKNKDEYSHYGSPKQLMDADDAINKHFRRHPEKLKEDCGIFESVEII